MNSVQISKLAIPFDRCSGNAIVGVFVDEDGVGIYLSLDLVLVQEEV